MGDPPSGAVRLSTADRKICTAGRFDKHGGMDKLVKLLRRDKHRAADLEFSQNACRFDMRNELGKIEKLPFGPDCDGWVGGASDP